MKDAQFVHMAHAGLRASANRPGKDKHWSVADLLNEAERTKGASKHIDTPAAPSWLLGSRTHVEEAEAAWRAVALRADRKHKIRVDSPSLAAVVVSWPNGREDGWLGFRDASINYYRDLYQERVVGIAEHNDEAHHHIHIFIVPLKHEPFGRIHPGVAARIAARSGDNRVSTAYITAMRKWCDDFWANVAVFHGLKRRGPERKRVSRKQFNAFKHERDLLNLEIEAAKLANRKLLAGFARERDEFLAEISEINDRCLKLKAELDHIKSDNSSPHSISSEYTDVSADDGDRDDHSVTDNDLIYTRERMRP